MNATPLLGYFGHHKCGTTWMVLMLRQICAATGLVMAHHDASPGFCGDIEAWRCEHPFDFWCYTNADYCLVRTLNVRGFHIVRDPRDVVVSAYFSHLNSHPTEDWPQLRFFRLWLQSISMEEGLLREMEILTPIFGSMLLWDAPVPGIMEVHFEDLIQNTGDHLCRIFAHLGLLGGIVPEALVRDVVEQYKFQRMSGGRPPGIEDTSHHFRKGVAGDWRHNFRERHVDYFRKLYTPLLLKLGYERSENWSV